MVKEKNKNNIGGIFQYRWTGYTAITLLIIYMLLGRIFEIGTNAPCWFNRYSCGSADALATTIQFIPIAILSTLTCVAFLYRIKFNRFAKTGFIIAGSALLSGIAWYYYVLAQI